MLDVTSPAPVRLPSRRMHRTEVFRAEKLISQYTKPIEGTADPQLWAYLDGWSDEKVAAVCTSLDAPRPVTKQSIATLRITDMNRPLRIYNTQGKKASASLESQVAELQSELNTLRLQFDQLVARLGG